MSVCLHACLSNTFTIWVPEVLRRGPWIPGSKVIGSGKPPGGRWELSLGPLRGNKCS